MPQKAWKDAQLDPIFLEHWGSRFAEAWNAHDPDAVVSLCTEDVVWSDPAMTAGPASGRDAVRDFAAFTFAYFPDFKVEERERIYVSPAEPQALCPYRMSGGVGGSSDGPPTQARFAVDAIDQWTFRGELMSRYVTFYDHTDMLRQLGGI